MTEKQKLAVQMARIIRSHDRVEERLNSLVEKHAGKPVDLSKPDYPKSRSLESERRRRIKQVILGRGDRCIYCGEQADTLEHITPRSKGGTDIVTAAIGVIHISTATVKAVHPHIGAADNLAPCCYDCNSERGNDSVLVFLLNRLS